MSFEYSRLFVDGPRRAKIIEAPLKIGGQVTVFAKQCHLQLTNCGLLAAAGSAKNYRTHSRSMAHARLLFFCERFQIPAHLAAVGDHIISGQPRCIQACQE